MTLLAELVNKKEIYTYEINHSQQYTLRGRFLLTTEIDDFYIDRTNKLYAITEKKIYALRHMYIEIAKNIYDYKIIDTEYGCLFFWVEKTNEQEDVNELTGKTAKYRLVCREANDTIMERKNLLILDDPGYKILVITRKNYVVYMDNKIMVQYKGKFYMKEFAFKIRKACILSEKLIFLDSENNIQLYCLLERKILSGFKSLGEAIDITTSKFVSLISVATVNGIFSIDVDNKNILKTKPKSEINFEYKSIEFINKRTLLIIGENVYEYNLMNGYISIVCETNRNSSFRYIFESNGYLIDDNFKDLKTHVCSSNQIILDMKIEMRRSLYKLNEKVEILEKRVKELENKKKD